MDANKNLTKNPYDRRREFTLWLGAARFTVNKALGGTKNGFVAGDVVAVVRTSTGSCGWFVRTLDKGRFAWVNESDLTPAN